MVFPRDGITKGEVVAYYAAIAKWMVPHVRDRRLTMQRFPSDIDGESVFHKNAPDYFPEWVRRVTVPKKGGTVDHVVCDDAATLVYIANQNCITPHIGMARVDKLDHPDQVVFDLDPAEDDFEVVRDVAWTVREVLERVGLTPFLRTTGSRGVHVVVPLDREWNFRRVRSLAQCLAAEVVRLRPADVTTELLKAKRGGRLFLDTNRNGTAQTAVPAFAVRARDGAPVAMPITWEELRDRSVNARTWTIRNAVERVRSWTDPWKGMARKAKSLDAVRSRVRECAIEDD